MGRVRIIETWFVPPGVAAWVPWPGCVLVRGEYARSVGLIAHELVHVEQWRRLGWVFPFAYVWGWVRANFVYSKNVFEVEAVERADEFRGLAEGLLKRVS